VFVVRAAVRTPGATTTKNCSACIHDKRAFIDQLLLEGVSPRSIAARVDRTSRPALRKHLKKCLSKASLSEVTQSEGDELRSAASEEAAGG
jgi:hypothetical protein